jgi:hypothetical protein
MTALRVLESVRAVVRMVGHAAVVHADEVGAVVNSGNDIAVPEHGSPWWQSHICVGCQRPPDKSRRRLNRGRAHGR